MTAQRTYTAKQWRHTQYASYFGYITQAIVNNLAPLLFLIFQDVYGIPLEKITLLVTVNFCVQLLVDMVAARFVDKIGYRPCIVAAHLFAAAGLAGLGLLPRLLPDPFVGCSSTPLGAGSSRCSSAPLWRPAPRTTRPLS